MAYSTPAEVRKVLAPEGDTDSMTAASLSDAAINSEITDTDSEINGYLRSRYALPFAQTPPLVNTISTDIAAYRAMLVHSRGKPIDPDHPVRLRYNRARDNLTAIAKGTIELVDSAGGEVADSAGPAVENRYEGELFPLEDLGLTTGPVHPALYRPYG